MEHAPEQRIDETHVIHRTVEALDGRAVHLLVRAVAAVHPNHRRLAAVLFAVGRRTAPRLAPVGRKPLRVLRVETVAEAMRDDLVGHDPFVPRAGETKNTFGT